MYHKKDTVPQGRQAERTSSTEKKKKKKAPWYKGKKIGLVVYTGHVSQGDYHAQGPLPGERALMLETRADTWLMQGSFTGWPVNHAVASAPQRNGSQT